MNRREVAEKYSGKNIKDYLYKTQNNTRNRRERGGGGDRREEGGCTTITGEDKTARDEPSKEMNKQRRRHVLANFSAQPNTVHSRDKLVGEGGHILFSLDKQGNTEVGRRTNANSTSTVHNQDTSKINLRKERNYERRSASGNSEDVRNNRREERTNRSENITSEDDNMREEEDKDNVRKKCIKFMSWNAEGILDKINQGDVQDFFEKFDILCITETFTSKNFNFDIKFRDYIPLHSPGQKLTRLGRISGGVIILIKKELRGFITKIDTGINSILAFLIDKTLVNTDKDVLFIGTYIHPVNSNYYNDKDYVNTIDMLDQFLADRVEQDIDNWILLTGDLNTRFGDWGLTEDSAEGEMENESNTLTRKSKDTIVNNNGKKMVEICSTYNLTPVGGLVDKGFEDNYTFISHRGCSVIDHFITSPELLEIITDFKTEELVEAQHQPITMTITSTLPEAEPVGTTAKDMKKTKWQDSKKEKVVEILNDPTTREELLRAEELVDDSIEQSINMFSITMQKMGKPMEIMVSEGGKGNRKRWFDKTCRNKRKATRQALRKMMKVKRTGNKEAHNRSRIDYITKRTDYHKTIKEKKTKFKNKEYEALMENRKDSKLFWHKLKEINCKKYTTPNISQAQWENHFSKLLNPENITSEIDEQDNNQPNEQWEIEIEELDQPIVEEEISRAIHKLKSGKAPGDDQILAENLKMAEGKIMPFLIKAFNKIYNTGFFPTAWAHSIMIPIFKKGNKEDPGNYRGISLLSILSKILTSILNTRLYQWAEDNNKINIEQAGFRQNFSTVDHIFTLHSMVSNCLYGRRRSKLYAAFIDFKKAFDLVRREILWDKLHRLGVSGKMIKMLKGIYKRVTTAVKIGGIQTGSFECPQGVRQGCQLSPLLFSLLISEIAERVNRGGRMGYQFIPGAKELFSLFFADDIVLIAKTPAGLQTQLNNLRQAAEEIGLTVNLEKTKIMIFRKGGFLGQHEKWFYGRERIETVNNYKYLGYTLTTKISADVALAEYAGRAKRRVIEIFRTLFKLGRLDVKIFFKLFDAQVKPMLLYAGEIWGGISYETIEKVQAFACKKLLNVSLRTPNTMVYGEIGRYPIFIDSIVRVTKYWHKLITMAPDRIPKQAYEREKLELTKKNGWAKTLKETLEINGFGDVWLNEGAPNMNGFIRAFKQRLIDCDKQKWHNKLTNSDRFFTYASYKEVHGREQYIEGVKINKFRRAFTRLRFGITEIRNNRTYREINPNVKCPLCEGDKEDEEHLLLKCTTYTNLRNKYIMRYWITQNNITIKDLLQNTEIEITRGVAAFIYYALKLRESLI